MSTLNPEEQPAETQAPAVPATETAIPLGNYVLLRRFKPEEKRGGVLIPETVRRDEQKVNPIATVIAVGKGLPMDGGLRYPIDVKPGDKVQLLRTLAEAVLANAPELEFWFVDVGQILCTIVPADA